MKDRLDITIVIGMVVMGCVFAISDCVAKTHAPKQQREVKL